MSFKASVIPSKKNVRLRGVVLPNEHGSWGFLFEPLIAALLAAFSPSAIWISLAVIGAFLTRQPLKVLLTDWQAGRDLPQTGVALRFTLVFGAFSIFGLFGSLSTAKIECFIPFLLVLPFGMFQIYSDARRRSRELLPELFGSAAISSSAPVIALAGGWSIPAAFALWAIFIARLIPSVLYVRNRLRLEKQKDFSRSEVIIAHLTALALVVVLAQLHLVSLLTVLMFIVLTFRSVWGLSEYRTAKKAMQIGTWEVVYGALTALSVVFGYYLKI